MVLITWLGLVYSTYWARLTYEIHEEKFQSEAQDACNQATRSLSNLLDKIQGRTDSSISERGPSYLMPLAPSEQVYIYNLEGLDETVKGKAWALLGTSDKFTTDKNQTKAVEVMDGQYVDVILNLPKGKIGQIDIIEFRFHNISSYL